jgi:hypothetical protein
LKISITPSVEECGNKSPNYFNDKTDTKIRPWNYFIISLSQTGDWEVQTHFSQFVREWKLIFHYAETIRFEGFWKQSVHDKYWLTCVCACRGTLLVLYPIILAIFSFATIFQSCLLWYYSVHIFSPVVRITKNIKVYLDLNNILNGRQYHVMTVGTQHARKSISTQSKYEENSSSSNPLLGLVACYNLQPPSIIWSIWDKNISKS